MDIVVAHAVFLPGISLGEVVGRDCCRAIAAGSSGRLP
jgi:hypothetical protein